MSVPCLGFHLLTVHSCFLFFHVYLTFLMECWSLCVKGILSRRSGVLESPRRFSSTPRHERAFIYCTSPRAPLCTAAPPSDVDHHCRVLGAGLQEVFSWFSCSASVVGKPPASQWWGWGVSLSVLYVLNDALGWPRQWFVWGLMSKAFVPGGI